MDNRELTDNDPISFGIHKGTKLANVPASYLLWCFDKGYGSAAFKNYVKRHESMLIKEAADNGKRTR